MVTAKRKHELEMDFAVPPGFTLADTLEALDMTQAQLALRTGLTTQTINRIIKGDQPITPNTANMLELTTGVPARMWNNLETQYREQLAKNEEKMRLAEDLDWLKQIPITELKNRGIISKQNDKTIQLREVLGFVGASSVTTFRAYWNEKKVAARKTVAHSSVDAVTAIWIRQGELQARGITCQPYNSEQFRSAVDEIRTLTKEPPEVFVPQLQSLCADAGVALCLVPEMLKAPWYGATTWLTPEKAMIQLSLRGKWADQFWFSFFHEAGHVLYDNKKEVYLTDKYSDDPREQRANRFAEETLIPEVHRSRIPTLKSHAEVEALAKELNILPAIIIGQFQRCTQKWGYFHRLRTKYNWNK